MSLNEHAAPLHCITNSMCFAEKRTCPCLFVKKVLSKDFYAFLHNNDLSEMCSILVDRTANCQTKGLWFKPQICYFCHLRTTFPLWQEKRYFFRFCVGHPRMRVNPPPLQDPPPSPPSNTSLGVGVGVGVGGQSATTSTTPVRQLLGSANMETTPAGTQAAAAARTQRPDAAREGKNG